MSKGKKPSRESPGPIADTSGPSAWITELDDNTAENSAITLIKTREGAITKVTGDGLTVSLNPAVSNRDPRTRARFS